MEPGIHRDVPAEVYHSWPLASNSFLTDIHEWSPSHAVWNRENPSDPTPALIVGDACHIAILEPKRFEERYVVAERCCNKTGKGDQCKSSGKYFLDGKWYCGTHIKIDKDGELLKSATEKYLADGWTIRHQSESSRYLVKAGENEVRISDHAPNATTQLWMIRNGVKSVRVDLKPYFGVDPRRVLSVDEGEMVKRIVAALHRPKNKNARKLIKSMTDIELSIVWDDPETGVRCKARFDGYRDGLAITDLKTTDCARESDFARTIFERGYHRQAAHYLNGASCVGLDVEAFAFIALEKDEPNEMAPYQLDYDSIQLGRMEVRKLLGVVADCQEKDEWPAYSQEIVTIKLPDYAAKRIERETVAV